MTGYDAAVSHEILETYSLPNVKSAYTTALISPVETRTLMKGQSTPVYIDEICFCSLSCSQHILKIPQILNLCQALSAKQTYNCYSNTGIYLSPKIAIVPCPVYPKEIDIVSPENNKPDKAAKYRAKNVLLYPFTTQFINLPLSLTDIINCQTNVP